MILNITHNTTVIWSSKAFARYVPEPWWGTRATSACLIWLGNWYEGCCFWTSHLDTCPFRALNRGRSTLTEESWLVEVGLLILVLISIRHQLSDFVNGYSPFGFHNVVTLLDTVDFVQRLGDNDLELRNRTVRLVQVAWNSFSYVVFDTSRHLSLRVTQY